MQSELAFKVSNTTEPIYHLWGNNYSHADKLLHCLLRTCALSYIHQYKHNSSRDTKSPINLLVCSHNGGK